VPVAARSRQIRPQRDPKNLKTEGPHKLTIFLLRSLLQMARFELGKPRSTLELPARSSQEQRGATIPTKPRNYPDQGLSATIPTRGATIPTKPRNYPNQGPQLSRPGPATIPTRGGQLSQPGPATIPTSQEQPCLRATLS
jgi:hypothetical protein